MRISKGLRLGPRALCAAASIVMLLAACDSGGTDTASSDAASPAAPAASMSAAQDTSWFMSGGDMHRASTLDDWRAADMRGRLAAASDLLSMKTSNMGDYDVAVQHARTLEAEITAAANAGDTGELGTIVDRVFADQGWPTD